jgi:hypothetical protein
MDISQQTSVVRPDRRLRRVCGLAIYGFCNFYVADASASWRSSRRISRRCDATSPRASRRRGGSGVPGEVTDLEHRLDSLKNVLPEQKDVADTLRRCRARDAVEPDAAALHAGGAEAAAALRRSAVSHDRDGSFHNLGAVLRSRQQVPAHHQRRRHLDRRQPRQDPTPRSSPT